MATSTYIPLASVVANGETAITFSNIPNTYRDLCIMGSSLGNSGNGVFLGAINGLTTDFVMGRFYTNSGGPNGDAYNNDRGLGTIGAAPGTFIIDILDYAQTNRHKIIHLRSDETTNIQMIQTTRWNRTEAINSFQLSANRNYQAGMTINLYGIAG